MEQLMNLKSLILHFIEDTHRNCTKFIDGGIEYEVYRINKQEFTEYTSEERLFDYEREALASMNSDLIVTVTVDTDSLFDEFKIVKIEQQ